MITLAYMLIAWPNQPPQDFIPNQASFPTWDTMSSDAHLVIIGLIVFGFVAVLFHYSKNGGKK